MCKDYLILSWKGQSLSAEVNATQNYTWLKIFCSCCKVKFCIQLNNMKDYLEKW